MTITVTMLTKHLPVLGYDLHDLRSRRKNLLQEAGQYGVDAMEYPQHAQYWRGERDKAMAKVQMFNKLLKVALSQGT